MKRKRGLSIREFARLDNCSHPLVIRGIRRGALAAYADGSLDPRLVGTEWRRGNWDPRYAHPAHPPVRTVHAVRRRGARAANGDGLR